MMNAEDAMGLQEDLARIGRRPTPAVDRLPASDESGNAVAAAVVAIRARNDAMSKLRQDLDASMSERNEVAALSKAARETLEIFARELARVTGADEADAVKQAHQILSRKFDANLDESISKRYILRDVRSMPAEMKKRPWYVPAP
ncbi:hypothetical protein [Cupriavidus pampae]|uniref:Uncharacterized protein n=1 Tax=Cupriavidus pampae TaxID=659251 RepID=A0ABM8XVW6_9BURK|nr:hypothetical protein [Cupriavidus pampae]CAG9184357.1 hypothetical protein LMG32289_05594 [Cupriavidus pampae]